MKVSFISSNEKLSGYASSLINWCNSNQNIDMVSIIFISEKKSVFFLEKFYSLIKLFFFKYLFLIDDFLSLNNKNQDLIRANGLFNYNDFELQYFQINYLMPFENKNFLNYISNSGIDLIVNFSNVSFPHDLKLKIITTSDIKFDLNENNIWSTVFNYVFYKKDSLIFEIFEEGEIKRKILINGYIETNLLFSVNRINLLKKKLFYTKLLIKNLLDHNKFNTIIQNRKKLFLLNKSLGLSKLITYLFRVFITLMFKISRKFLGFENRWGVAFTYNLKDLNFSLANKFEVNKMHFIADPFLYSFQNQTYCFVEEYDYYKKKGFISVYSIDNIKSNYLGKVLEENFHLSFPYIFEYKNDIFMCPETSQNNDIRLYKSIDFPFKWNLHKILVQDVCAADTLIFEKDSIWWMFTNIDPLNLRENCSELHIFYSDSPLSNHWKPHKMNPVIIDSEKSRNAGLIFEDDSYYRVCQHQGFDLYGKSSSVREIIKLSTDYYEEKLINEIKPNFFKKIKGTHHISKYSNYTAFDYVEISNKFYGKA